MIVGIGVDVCSIERMKRALDRHGERFFARICSERERKDLEGREPGDGARRALRREGGVRQGARRRARRRVHDVEVRRRESGRPVLELRGTATDAVVKFGADRWHVSISHDAEVAVAMVVLEGRAMIPFFRASRCGRSTPTRSRRATSRASSS